MGYEVIGIDNLSHPSDLALDPGVVFKWGDVRNTSDCQDLVNKSDIIIHLAAEISVDKSIIDPQRVLEVNVNGTKNILEAVRKCSFPGAKEKMILIASSSEVYGDCEGDIQDEKAPLNGKSPYAASKIAADRLGYAYFKTYGMDVRIVRAFNVCGEGQGKDSYGAVIAIFADKIHKSQPPTIFGDGTQTRDYTHVSDTVEGYIKILEEGKAGEVYNIATGEDWSVLDVWNELIAHETTPWGHGHPEDPWYEFGPARSGEVMKLKGDASKLRALGWEPKITFKEAIERIWQATK